MRMVSRIRSGEVAGDADAGAFQRTGLEKLGVVRRNPPGAPPRGRIGRIDTGQHIQHDRNVVHTAGNRSDGIVVRQGQQARAADETARRLEPHHAVRGGRATDRAGGIGAKTELREHGGDGRAGSAARRAGTAPRIVRVAGLAAERTETLGDLARLEDGGIFGTDHASAARGELAQVGLAEHDRAGVAKFPDDEGVGRWNRAFEQLRAAGGGQVGGVEVVLQDDWNAVQRAANLAGVALGVQGASLAESFRVERYDRVDVRASFVIGGNPGEIHFRECLRRERAVVERDVEVRDRRIRQVHLHTRLPLDDATDQDSGQRQSNPLHTSSLTSSGLIDLRILLWLCQNEPPSSPSIAALLPMNTFRASDRGKTFLLSVTD